MLTKFSKILIGLAIVGVIGGALYYLGSNPTIAEKIVPGSQLAEVKKAPVKPVRQAAEDVIIVAANTWGGQAGLAYMNNGSKDASKSSRFYTEFGQEVRIEVMDDFNNSREALKGGAVDVLMFATDGEYSIEADGLSTSGVKLICHYDKSFGGDALVVREGINSIRDLVGKTIALAPGTPSHGLFLNLIKVSGLTQDQFVIKEAKDGLDAADFFKKEQVDAAFVWSPDDKDCIAKVAGSKVLLSTKSAPDIIWDVMLTTDKALSKKRDAIKNFVAGVLYGNAQINTSTVARTEAVTDMSKVFNQSDDSFWSNLEIAKFMTYGDNLNFFGFNPSYKGVTGEELYTRMGEAYRTLKLNSGESLLSGNVPSWRLVSDPSIIRELESNPKLNTKAQVAEAPVHFAVPTAAVRSAAAVTTNHVTVEFPSGSSELSVEAKRIIKRDFGNLARGFSTAYIRIEGNTDNIGSPDFNVKLSLNRALSVKNYLIATYGWDSNRIIALGNGPDKPVADNDTPSGRQKNRRTDFELVTK